MLFGARGCSVRCIRGEVSGANDGRQALLFIHASSARIAGLWADQRPSGACGWAPADGLVRSDLSGGVSGRSRLRVACDRSLTGLRWADGLSFRESLAFLSLRKFDAKGFFVVMPVVFVVYTLVSLPYVQYLFPA